MRTRFIESTSPAHLSIRQLVVAMLSSIVIAGLFCAPVLSAEGAHEHVVGTKSGSVSSEALRDVGVAIANMAMGCATECGLETFEPIQPILPDHLWIKGSADYVLFVHFDKGRHVKSAKVLFVGDGVRGRFCAEDQPDGGETGYVHFHRTHTPPGMMSHGGEPGVEGWWLRHVSVGHFEMDIDGTTMKMKPGLAMNFFPTLAPSCSQDAG